MRIWQIACAVLAVVAIAAVIVMATNADNGSRWRSRATSAEALATELQEKLTGADASAQELQQRTIDLAAEKAEAEDNAMVRTVDAKLTARVADDLQTCSEGISGLFDALARAETIDELNALASGRADEVFGQCAQASDAAGQLATYLEDLDG